MRTLLAIEGNGHDLESLRERLRDLGYAVSVVPEGSAGAECWPREPEKRRPCLFDHAPLGIFHARFEGALLRVNPALARMYGYDSPARMVSELNDAGRAEAVYCSCDRHRDVVAGILRSDDWGRYEGRFRRRDGTELDGRVRLCPVPGRRGEIEGFIEDITECKRAEVILQESEQRYCCLLETLPLAAYGTDVEGRITFYNSNAVALWGRKPALNRDRWCGSYRLWHPDGRPMAFDECPMALTLKHGKPFQGREVLVERSCGDLLHVVAYSEPLYDAQGGLTGVVNLLVDITERKNAEKRLQASLAEKEVLLKEIHHRVKNNLQVVSSLLDLQSAKLPDAAARSLFAESQSRIFSMALAHEQLYQSKNLAEIDLADYIRNLVSHVRQAFMTPEAALQCRLEVEAIVLDIEKVVPCGLLMTELLSNALKHAFPDGRRGIIDIAFGRRGDELELTVADNGIGLPADFHVETARTLGLQLVAALVEQLNGVLTVESRGGARFSLSFPV
jgi:PAS domain S-box-containing protein